MAIALLNQFVLTPPCSAYVPNPSKTSEAKTIALRTAQHLSLCKTSSWFVLSPSSSIGRRSFKCSLALEDSEFNTIDREVDTQVGSNTSAHKDNQKDLSRLETLIKVYKEAILDGDETTVLDIEAAIYKIENEKNELVQKVSALSADITSGKEKYIRLQADFDNFRKRADKDRLTIKSDAQGEVVESLLSMVDSFERAKQQIRPETDKEKKIDTSYQGIYKQFVEIMRSLCVAALDTVGKPFDPSIHEAIAREESLEFKEGIIIQEVRRGFLLGDRLLRPAMVKVSAGSGRKNAPAATDKSTGQPAATARLDESSVPKL